MKQARHALYLAEDVSPKKDPDVRKMQVRLRVPVLVEALGFRVVWSRKGDPDVRKMQRCDCAYQCLPANPFIGADYS